MRSVLKIGKRASSGEDISWPEIIWLVLLVVFIGFLFIFVRNAVNGSLLNEEIYAKKIALLIDNAKPNTTILLDVSNIARIALKNGKQETSIKNMIRIENNTVKVSLRLGETQNTAYKYFSDYNVSGEWSFVDGIKTIQYRIKIGDEDE